MNLAWAMVELVGDGVEVGLVEHAEVGALGEVLPKQPVGVLVGAALPRAAWLAEVDRIPVSAVTAWCSAISRPRSQVSVRRSWGGMPR